MNKFTLKNNGELSAVSYIQATHQHKCECGGEFEITLQWPENLVLNGTPSINGVICPNCQTPVTLPQAQYFVENYQLLSK